MISLAMNPGWIQETFKSQWDKTFYQASFGCEENTEISISSRINWTSPPTLCFSIIVWCQNFWNLILSNLILKKCSRSNTLHQSSTWASILMRNIWNVRQGKLRINFFTLQRTCMIVYETLMCQASAAYGRGEGRRPACPHSNIFVFKACKAEEVRPSHTAQIARNFSKLFALFLTSLRNVTIIISSISPILATIFNTPWIEKWK